MKMFRSIMTFIINTVANFVISRFNKKLRGETKKTKKNKLLKSKVIKDSIQILYLSIIAILFGWLLSTLFEYIFAIIITLILLGCIFILRIISPLKLEQYKILIYSSMLIILIYWVLSTWFSELNSLLICGALVGFVVILKMLNRLF